VRGGGGGGCCFSLSSGRESEGKRPLSPDGVQPAARANSESTAVTRAILEIKSQIECISPRAKERDRDAAQMNERANGNGLFVFLFLLRAAGCINSRGRKGR